MSHGDCALIRCAALLAPIHCVEATFTRNSSGPLPLVMWTRKTSQPRLCFASKDNTEQYPQAAMVVIQAAMHTALALTLSIAKWVTTAHRLSEHRVQQQERQ